MNVHWVGDEDVAGLAYEGVPDHLTVPAAERIRRAREWMRIDAAGPGWRRRLLTFDLPTKRQRARTVQVGLGLEGTHGTALEDLAQDAMRGPSSHPGTMQLRSRVTADASKTRVHEVLRKQLWVMRRLEVVAERAVARTELLDYVAGVRGTHINSLQSVASERIVLAMNHLAAHGYIAPGAVGQYAQEPPPSPFGEMMLELIERGALKESRVLELAGPFLLADAELAFIDDEEGGRFAPTNDDGP